MSATSSAQSPVSSLLAQQLMLIGVTTCRSEFIRELFWSLILFMMGIRG
ncbi:hypothetical protein HTZ97_10470 [Desulfuromonas acetoxidans]|nr:hypothetical protein [Desulfuromonas acetoxidans]MBF0646032.1 hypothetical protein [Desulfuromonas acetoxidans]NVD25857.1 hypothetical protein [Desulfuromonas acetoxidans]NVE16889.1 hypothetical protein [Desulfuromonas acetoxidans]